MHLPARYLTLEQLHLVDAKKKLLKNIFYMASLIDAALGSPSRSAAPSRSTPDVGQVHADTATEYQHVGPIWGSFEVQRT